MAPKGAPGESLHGRRHGTRTRNARREGRGVGGDRRGGRGVPPRRRGAARQDGPKMQAGSSGSTRRGGHRGGAHRRSLPAARGVGAHHQRG